MKTSLTIFPCVLRSALHHIRVFPVEQSVAPQPTEPTENENACFEVPFGMGEKLLANPFLGDGTLHPDLHLIYVDEVCGLFNL